MWSQILISISCLIGMVLLLNRIPENHPDIKIASVSALLFILAIEIITFIPIEHEDLVSEGLIVLVFTTLLSLLLMITRAVKPDFARYPYPFVYMPVIILLVYPFILDAEALTSLVMMLLQGGAITVVFLLYSGHTERFKYRWLIISGAISLLAAYVIYWFLEDITGGYYSWSWQFFVALGMVALAVEIPRVLVHSSKK